MLAVMSGFGSVTVFGALYGADVLAYLILIDGTIPGVSLIHTDPWEAGAANRSWHFFFNQVESLPERLITGRERELLEWWFRSKARHPDLFIDQEMRFTGSIRSRTA